MLAFKNSFPYKKRLFSKKNNASNVIFSHFSLDTYHLNINELYLETHVRGYPHPTVEWLKDSVNIARNDPKYQVFDHPDGLCELIVNDPGNADCGKYLVKATNRVGTTELGHYVLFEGKEHHIAENIHGVYHADFSHRSKPQSLENGVEEPPPEEDKGSKKGSQQGSKAGSKAGSKIGSKAGSRAETPVKEKAPPPPPPSREPPPPAKKEPRGTQLNFPTKLSNRVAPANSRVKLTCYLEGLDPSIRWFKGENPVVYSPKCRQTQQNGLCILEFTSVQPEDAAVYKCWARNEKSEASTSCKLEVFSSGDSADLAPTFTRSIKETYNSRSNEINISCHVRAYPTPTITWSKDGVTVEPSERYQLTEHDDGVCELNIADATKQDNGKYVCMADNRAGKTETTHLVQIDIPEKRSSITSLKDVPPSPASEDAKSVSSRVTSVHTSRAASEEKAASVSGDSAAKGAKPARQKKDAPPPSGGGRRYGTKFRIDLIYVKARRLLIHFF